MSADRVSLPSLKDVRWIEFPSSTRADGDLYVMQAGAEVPFELIRVFVVRAEAGATRGQHAHRRCSQLLVCVSGVVDVTCEDGAGTAHFVLDTPKRGLLVPPTIWAEQQYSQPHSTLMVLCDRPYEAEDYIRDYSEFRALHAPAGSSANWSVTQ
jgi:dTDP-4-dehydrorhamnose 3,5-epimerase-like enzyme